MASRGRPPGCTCTRDWWTLRYETAGCPIHSIESPTAVTRVARADERSLIRALQAGDDADVYICGRVVNIPGGEWVHCHDCGADVYASPSTVAAMIRGARASCFRCVPPATRPGLPTIEQREELRRHGH